MLRRGTAGSKTTSLRGGWTRSRTKPLRICERDAALNGEAPRQCRPAFTDVSAPDCLRQTRKRYWATVWHCALVAGPVNRFWPQRSQNAVFQACEEDPHFALAVDV